MSRQVSIIMGIALGIVLISLLFKQCQNAAENDSKIESYHNETHDTIYVAEKPITITKTIIRTVPHYITVSTPVQIASKQCDSLRAYLDSLRIDSTSIVYYSDTVLGKKLTYRLTYSGKPYTKIIKESIHDSIIHIENRKIYTNGFYFNCDMGGSIHDYAFNKSAINPRLCFGIGADYMTKKRLQVGYRYGVYENSHSVRIGIKLF